MTEPTEEKPQLRPSKWPAEWFKQESFWREVTARALSGLIVVLVGYIVLAASGLLGLPSPVRLLSALLVIGAAALILYPWVKISQWIIKTINKMTTRWIRIAATFLWGVVFLVVLFYIMLVAQSVAMWAYNNVPT